eukprot:TRINITY_DN1288_c0_g1_i1.p1 TRINITY_DN1288_c0_g1~~TRINITY_DN1288_c0_g1_i1.p1  ORF type:complete len:241 (-),score=27.37 TRINITY_DN1288_c0_g1_i1:11-733(-)
MDFLSQSRRIDWNAIGKTSHLTPEIKEHLVNVYTTLALTILVAAIGAITYIKTYIGGTGSFFVGFLLLIWLNFTPRHEVTKRLGILCGFAFIEGLSIGPLVDAVIDIDPAIVTSAFLGTTCIFLCFSASAILSQRRSYFFLAGLLSSALSMLVFLSFMNLFFRSIAVFNIQLYGGLVLFCGFVIFDTQLIIEKAATGNKDYVSHSLELFLDFISIFVRLLIILSKNKKESNSNNNNRRNR